MSYPITRRSVLCSLGTSMAVSYTGLASGLRFLGENGVTTDKVRFGAQTNAFPIHPDNFQTFLDALQQIRSVGYDGFETGFINLRSQAKSLSQARRQIEVTGLAFLGVHIFLPEYDAVTNLPPRNLYESVAHQGAATGAERLIFSGAPAVTPDEVKRKADELNVAGEFASTLGLKLAYHNHWWEVKYKAKELEGLYSQTNPANVSFLMDIGHASRTDLDISDFVRRHTVRLIGFHFRDFIDGKQVPLGLGKFPLHPVVAALKQAGWSGWAINEEERLDGSKLGLTAIEPSFRALKEAFSA